METKQLYQGGQPILPVTEIVSIGSVMAGDMRFQQPSMTDYAVIMIYGQSLSTGTESAACFIDEPAENVFMPQYGVNNLFMEGDDVKVTSLRPLGASGSKIDNDFGVAKGSQDSIISAANAFVNLYHKEYPFDDKTKFIVVSLGWGGMSLVNLHSAERYPWAEHHFYDTRVVPCLTSLKDLADEEGKTISMVACVWCQGETDYSGRPENFKSYEQWYATQQSSFYSSKEAYKEGLRLLKNDLQELASSLFNQQLPFVFATYLTGGSWVGNEKVSIDMAQLELADEDDDVVVVAPNYQVPEYKSGHLSMNGYRWYGEYIARALYFAILKNEDCKVLRPVSFDVQGNKIIIGFNGNVDFDTYTCPEAIDMGFVVRQGTSRQLDTWTTTFDQFNVGISSISIDGKDVIIECDTELNAEALSVSYACNDQRTTTPGYLKGTGNLREKMQTWLALNEYKEDSSDHGNMNSGWDYNGITEAEKQAAQWWVEGNAYNTGDVVKMPSISREGNVYWYKCKEDSVTTCPYGKVNYYPKDKDGNSLVGKKYPMWNWCINFYKRLKG